MVGLGKECVCVCLGVGAHSGPWEGGRCSQRPGLDGAGDRVTAPFAIRHRSPLSPLLHQEHSVSFLRPKRVGREDPTVLTGPPGTWISVENRHRPSQAADF